MRWYKKYISQQLTYPHKKPCGRPPLSKEVKKIILELKNENLLWGNRRISDELNKLNIEVSAEKVRKVISDFRKKGKVNKTQTWTWFLKSHWNSLFAMDSFHVYSALGKQFYVLVILELKSRKIVQFAVTENPVREFIRQQMILFSEKYPQNKTLIHDRAP